MSEREACGCPPDEAPPLTNNPTPECSPPPRSACCPPAKPAAEPCCPPPEKSSACCPPEEAPAEIPGYRPYPWVTGQVATPFGSAPRVGTTLGWRDRLGHWAMRWGLGRMRYRVTPGLYAVGSPAADSPVLVSANYKMSFDLLRRELAGLDAWLLVIDTRGINVWCAAGKGTFGTGEIVGRVRSTGLSLAVSHRTLILPQLGAPGVAAHRVKKECGFTVVYGPVRAADLPAFLAAGNRATEAMRRVSFSALERLVLTPVELVGMGRISLRAAAALLLLGGIGSHWFSLASAGTRGGGAILVYLAGLASGAVLTPLLLPWIPGRAFALKGALVGTFAAGAALAAWGGALGLWNTLALALALPAVASYCAMNFTGSTPYTSPSGVEKEMRRAIPLQAAALLVAGVAWVAGAF